MSGTDMSWFAWWSEADWIIRSVFIILVLLSLASWTMMIQKVFQFKNISKFERLVRQYLLGSNSPRTLVLHHPAHVPSVHLAEELPDHAELSELNEFAGQILREKKLDLESGLTLLATIGNSAPFIGLFGTVWGIMHALQALGGVEQISMDMIAGPVAEALVATAVGLMAAIPAVIGYNFLLRKLRRLNALIDGNAVRIVNHWGRGG
ncbi:MAG: MotA/TolQ/ExbB proton channel family protein [Terasakiella sp.]|uniref:MotA/TolQ/ExbB proton channel family protein n=1 Tax=unclassified Terasakiella TaxID=2614952 RepID=UPI003B0031DC